MEALNFIEGSKPLDLPEVPRILPDLEFLEDLKAWGPTEKTVKSEIEFLTRYVEAHGFERDRQRLAALELYLAG